MPIRFLCAALNGRAHTSHRNGRACVRGHASPAHSPPATRSDPAPNCRGADQLTARLPPGYHPFTTHLPAIYQPISAGHRSAVARRQSSSAGHCRLVYRCPPSCRRSPAPGSVSHHPAPARLSAAALLQNKQPPEVAPERSQRERQRELRTDCSAPMNGIECDGDVVRMGPVCEEECKDPRVAEDPCTLLAHFSGSLNTLPLPGWSGSRPTRH